MDGAQVEVRPNLHRVIFAEWYVTGLAVADGVVAKEFGLMRATFQATNPIVVDSRAAKPDSINMNAGHLVNFLMHNNRRLSWSHLIYT
jgi:hypothetical protein